MDAGGKATQEAQKPRSGVYIKFVASRPRIRAHFNDVCGQNIIRTKFSL